MPVEQVRLEKKVAIARSGVQYYLPREVRAMDVTVPKEFEKQALIGVYRSAPMLAAKKDLFGGRPFINTHKGFINPENYTKFAQGWTSDEVAVELNADKTEAVITADLKILGQEALDAYNSGTRQVSPHYGGQYDWEPGTAPDGTAYQVIMRELDWVNHVALVPRGRGGPDASIQDHAPNPLTDLWYRITAMFKKGVSDEESPSFRQQLEEIAKLRATLSEDQMEERARALYDCVRLMPVSEDVDLLYRFLADMKLLTSERTDEESAAFVDEVATLYEKIDSQTLAEITAQQKKDVQGQEDAMTEEEKKAEEAKKAAEAKDAEEKSKEMDEFMAKVKDHVAGGGKLSDWKVSDEESEEEKAKKDKEAKDKAAKDAEAEEAKKKEDDEAEKKKSAEDAAPAVPLRHVYDHTPFNMSMGGLSTRIPASDAGDKILRNAGYLPKEKK